MELHIAQSFTNGGAGIAAAQRASSATTPGQGGGLRIEGTWDWKRTVVRRILRLIGCPMDVSYGIVKLRLSDKCKVISDKCGGIDHVFIHWIGHEMLRYEELLCFRKEEVEKVGGGGGRAPQVTVVLHDFSLFEAPVYRKETWFDRWRLRRIRRVLEALDVDFEAPSEWAARHIKELWPGARVEVRPTPVRKIFGRGEREIREKKRILFACSGGRSNPYKGYADLEKALEYLTIPYELRVVGEERVLTPEEMLQEYLNADVLAFPSLSETQGLVKCEALACGLKVVAFDRAACAEGIEHLKTGYVAKAGDCEDFARGLMWALGLAV